MELKSEKIYHSDGIHAVIAILKLERDINAAINILKRAIADFKTVGLIVSACGGDRDSPLLKQEAKEMLTGFELTLF